MQWMLMMMTRKTEKELDLHDILSFDAEFGKILQELQILVCRKQYLEATGGNDRDGIVDLRFRGTSVEDICLDFKLPGSPDYILMTGEDNMDINNLDEYISLVFDATIKNGIMLQVKTFNAGFNQSVKGMKVVFHELALVMNDPGSSAMDELVKDSDKLVLCLATKVAKTFDFSFAGASSRSCKYVLITVMQTFQIKKLAHAVKESTFHSLITELCFCSWMSVATTESVASRDQKFSDLVVKCLIKLTKVDIFSRLQNASEAFRTYIRVGLAQMEKNAAAGRTASSVPMSTPPPAALNVSPKLLPYHLCM